MPELPEVETVCRTLQQLTVGRKIQSVDVYLPRIIRRPADPNLFCQHLLGQTILSIKRRAKYICFEFDSLYMISHLRMEGRYGLHHADDPFEKHTHVVFKFEDNSELRYRDVRQFGTMDIVKREQLNTLPPLTGLGIEPLETSFTSKALREILGRKSGKIKPLLLNQSYIVGLGNIYVDEALHAAGVNPEQPADSISAVKWKALHTAIVMTLNAAVDAGGSSIKSYVNGQGEIGLFQHQFQVYGRQGEPCQKCSDEIVKTVLAGRGTHWCPRCQKRSRQKRKD